MNLEEQGSIIILKFRKLPIYLFKHLNMSIMMYPWPVTTPLGAIVCVWKMQYDCPNGKTDVYTSETQGDTFIEERWKKYIT